MLGCADSIENVDLQKITQKDMVIHCWQKPHDEAGTAWKESQAFAKELNDLDDEFSMD